jgi:predicted dehydrogenase
LTVFDSDLVKAKKIAARYNVGVTEELNESDFKNFDLISITTPTTTHFSYLQKLLPQFPGVIICEKPVVSSSTEAHELGLYDSSDSKVLVNYMRRFQPAFLQLKEKLRTDYSNGKPKAFIIKYNRGFVNNASHAVDLLEFLFDEPFDFSNFLLQKFEFDALDYDPTLTGSCLFLESPVCFTGLAGVNYPVFEIEIFYSDSKIVICHSGNEIRYYDNEKKSLKETERQTNILDKYMLPVMDEAIDLFYERKSGDNFLSALNMNLKMFNIVESIKITNATISH